MATFGKQVSTGGPAAKPAFGRKTAPSPMGRAAPSAREQLSPQALAFLQSERSRAPEPASKSGAARSSTAARPAPQPGYAMPAGIQAGKPVWGRRILATLIDSAVFLVPLILIIAAMGPQPGTTDAQFAAGFIGVILFLGLGSLAYCIAMESSSLQATLGKMAVGAVVTDKTGGKPTLGAIIMRNTLGKLLSSLTPFYISYLMGLFRQDRRCLRDLMAGTMVRKRGADGAPANYGDVFA